MFSLTKFRNFDLTSIPFGRHVLLNTFIRLFLIIYSEVQDRIAEVPYTDIDYRVVTDGARHILNNESPFRRHTYRYSPLLAYLMIPNILLHPSFGKVLFSLCDIVSSILIRNIVYSELLRTSTKGKPTEKFRKWSEIASFLMLYNPIGIVISSRGSNDAISNFLILATFYFIQKSNLSSCLWAGIFHGLAIHFRIFPIIFSLAYFLCFSNHRQSVWKAILLPNLKQIILAVTTVLSLSITTYVFFTLYGMEYLHEAYLYHFSRIDIRHNFSLYFLMQYLNLEQTALEKVLVFLPRIIVLLYLSLTFGRDRKTLAFCIFAQTFIFVTFNTVVTSQYFVWYLTLLPLCYANFRHVSIAFIVANSCVWLVGQGLWLLSAYLLEFKSWNTFNVIGLQSAIFFLANIYVLKQLIYNYV